MRTVHLTSLLIVSIAVLHVCPFNISSYADEEAYEMHPKDVKNWPEYENATLSTLESYTPESRPKEVSLSETEKQQLEQRLQAMLSKLNVKMPATVEWDGNELSVYTEHINLFAVSDTGDEWSYLSLSLDQLPLRNDAPTTVTSVRRYALKLYRTVFGYTPIGTPAFEYGGEGLTDGDGESVTWKGYIDGVKVKSRASVQINRGTKKTEKNWHITMKRGPNTEDITDLRSFLENNPVQITEREAVAITVKNWLSNSTLPKTKGTKEPFFISVRQKPFDGLHFDAPYHELEKYWKHPSAPDKPTYVYHVRMNQNLFQVQCAVDWKTGNVLYLSQGRLSW